MMSRFNVSHVGGTHRYMKYWSAIFSESITEDSINERNWPGDNCHRLSRHSIDHTAKTRKGTHGLRPAFHLIMLAADCLERSLTGWTSTCVFCLRRSFTALHAIRGHAVLFLPSTYRNQLKKTVTTSQLTEQPKRNLPQSNFVEIIASKHTHKMVLYY